MNANEQLSEADQRAAHALLTELRTRITSQPLPFFAREARQMLNLRRRPVTARWHRLKEAGFLNARVEESDLGGESVGANMLFKVS